MVDPGKPKLRSKTTYVDTGQIFARFSGIIKNIQNEVNFQGGSKGDPNGTVMRIKVWKGREKSFGVEILFSLPVGRFLDDLSEGKKSEKKKISIFQKFW